MTSYQFQITNDQSKLFSVISVPSVASIKGGTVFKGLGNLANIGSFMKQAQEMSGRMQAMQQQLKTKRATGAAGGGLVEVDVNGLGEALAVRIDASLIEKNERDMIEDLLPAAINAAQTKAKQLHAEAMQSIAGDLPIPGISEALMQLGGGPNPGGAPNS